MSFGFSHCDRMSGNCDAKTNGTDANGVPVAVAVAVGGGHVQSHEGEAVTQAGGGIQIEICSCCVIVLCFNLGLNRFAKFDFGMCRLQLGAARRRRRVVTCRHRLPQASSSEHRSHTH